MSFLFNASIAGTTVCSMVALSGNTTSKPCRVAIVRDRVDERSKLLELGLLMNSFEIGSLTKQTKLEKFLKLVKFSNQV